MFGQWLVIRLVKAKAVVSGRVSWFLFFCKSFVVNNAPCVSGTAGGSRATTTLYDKL
jgi:hypothetical protein